MYFPVLHGSVLAVYLFHTQCFVSADPGCLLHAASALSLSVTVSLFPMSVSLLLSCTEAHLFTVWIPPRGGVECYLSFSVRPPLVWSSPGSSMSLEMVLSHGLYDWVVVCCVMTASYSLPCWWTGRSPPCLGFCKQCCSQHRRASMFSNWSFLRIHAQERDCCLRWGLGCWLPEEPLLLPTMAAPTCFPSGSAGGPPSPHPSSVSRM